MNSITGWSVCREVTSVNMNFRPITTQAHPEGSLFAESHWSPTTTWTRSWSTSWDITSVDLTICPSLTWVYWWGGNTPPTITWTQSWRGLSTYHHMNSIMGRTLHLPPHKPNYGEDTPPTTAWTQSWASYQICIIAGCAWNAGNVFPHRRLQRKLLVNDPGMHHGTCLTHVPWCMSVSPTLGGRENVPGACATRDFAYLVRGPWGGNSTYHHRDSIMGRTLHLPPHELNHGEDTPLTTTWTQSWGGLSTYHHMNSIMGGHSYHHLNSIMERALNLPPHELNHGEYTPPTTTQTQPWGGHYAYHHMDSIMGRTLHLRPHEPNHGDDNPPTTAWTHSWGGNST